MIVVEGPDGAGKTTLIEKLAKEFELPISPKLVNSDMSTNMSKKLWCENNVGRGFNPTLFDRHCLISEPIYNSVTKQSTEPGFGNVQWYTTMMTMFYKTCHPLIIYCLPSYTIVRDNVRHDHHQPLRVQKSIRKIYAQYVAKAAADVPLAGAMVYDYTFNDTESIFRQVEQAVERVQHV